MKERRREKGTERQREGVGRKEGSIFGYSQLTNQLAMKMSIIKPSK